MSHNLGLRHSGQTNEEGRHKNKDPFHVSISLVISNLFVSKQTEPNKVSADKHQPICIAKLVKLYGNALFPTP